MKSKKRRNAQKGKQRVAKRYSKAREDAQLLGIIDTTPAEAVSNEMVDPTTQGSQPLPGLIGRAVRNNWATPDHVKPKMVDEMVELVLAEETDAHVKVSAVRVLQQGDQLQWERDNPELAGKTKGGTKVDINNQVTTQVGFLDMARAVIARPDPEEEAKKEVLKGAADDQANQGVQVPVPDGTVEQANGGTG